MTGEIEMFGNGFSALSCLLQYRVVSMSVLLAIDR